MSLFMKLMKETKKFNQVMMPVTLMGNSLCIIIINGLGGPQDQSHLKRAKKLTRASPGPGTQKTHCFSAGLHKSLLSPQV